MLRAFLAPTWRCAFMLQMYATGFITVVLTPMMGPDVALGAADYIHCYSAMIYVFDHWIANEFILGVPLLSPYGICFAVTASVCGVFQFLRADNDLFARKLHTRTGMSSKSFATFKSILEIGFMLTENLLFFIFLFGMTSGVTPESFALAAKVTPPTKDEDAGGASSPPPTMMDAFVVSLIIAAVAALWLRRGNLGAAAPAAEATKAKKTPAAKPKTKTPAAKAKRLWPRTSLRARPRTSTPTAVRRAPLFGRGSSAFIHLSLADRQTTKRDRSPRTKPTENYQPSRRAAAPQRSKHAHPPSKKPVLVTRTHKHSNPPLLLNYQLRHTRQTAASACDKTPHATT